MGGDWDGGEGIKRREVDEMRTWWCSLSKQAAA